MTDLTGDEKSLLKVEISTKPQNLTIDFSVIDEVSFVAKDILRCELKGNMTEFHKLNRINIVQCSARELNSTKVDYSYVDFKDSSFFGCTTKDSVFDYGAIINDYYQDCSFQGSRFNNLSITGTEFYGTLFSSCNLEHMVIKSCKFINCKFINCTTSNKLFETSLLLNCKFINTNIEIKTIIENFGITSDNLEDVQIRDKSLKENYHFIPINKVKLAENNGHLNEIEKFKIEYLLNRNILTLGGQLLDSTFIIDNWLDLCNIPSNFNEQLTLYYDFLIYHYDNNSLPFYLLLKFHSMTAELAYKHQLKPDLYRAVMGVHMSLTRLVEDFIDIMRICTSVQQFGTIRVLASGPVEIKYYEEHLGHLLNNSNLRIEKVVLHNSPTEIIFSWESLKDIIPLICLVLSVKFKLGLTKLKIANNEVTLKEDGIKEVSNNLQLFDYESGFSKEDMQLYQIKIKALMPGNLLLDLRLGISTIILGRLRSIVIDLLDPIKKS